MPEKRRLVGTLIMASSVTGSLSGYHCCNRWIRSIDAGEDGGRPLLAGLGMVGLNQSLPWHHQLHLREKILPFDLLLGRGELAILEAKLLLQPISPVLACDDDVIVA